jgi:magnesium-transporting ATPase (P-type)
MHFHTKDIDKALSILETNTSGLKSEEASKRQEQYGLNILPSKPYYLYLTLSNFNGTQHP